MKPPAGPAGALAGVAHPAAPGVASRPKNPKHTRPVKGSATVIPGRCGMPLRNAPGRFCPRWPVAGRKRCKTHGGRALAGVAHPSWKGGRSKYVPQVLAAKYADALADPKLLTLHHEIAVVDARIAGLLQSLQPKAPGAPTANWTEALGHLKAWTEATIAGKKGDAGAAILKLQALLTAGAAEAGTWAALQEAIDLRRKLTESEARVEKDLQIMVRTDKFYQLIDLLVLAVKENVTDDQFKALGARGVQQAIHGQIVRLIGGSAGEGIGAS